MACRAWIGVACATLLAGCSPGPGQSDGTSLPRGQTLAARPVFATQLAGPSTFLAPMPTAVVVLKPGDLNRNRAFCKTITERLPTAQQAMASSVVARNLVLTRWLVQLSDLPVERATDCDLLVGVYDYARAAGLLNVLRISSGQLSGPGPFLLMVIPDGTGLHIAGLDGSAYDATDFGRFVDRWGDALRQTESQITRVPDQPGLLRSMVNLVAAILRTVAGGTGGLIQGVVATL